MSKIGIVLMAVLMSIAACAQNADQKPQPPAAAQNPAGGAAAEPRPDAAQQMKMDLDQMDSLLNNMATQTSFIRDTNISILLNTNVRLWSLLLRDLRLQMEEQQRAAHEKANSPQRH
jgi:hypothetical protein